MLITLAFLGLSASATSILFQPLRSAREPVAPPRQDTGDGQGGQVATLTRAEASVVVSRGEPSAWMVVPMVAGVIALLVLGLHPPGELTELIAQAVAQLRGVA